MGNLFRSEEMTLCQLFLQSEAAYACVSELGELGLVQFKDLNPDVNSFQRKFVSEIVRCEEMERKLRYIEKELKKDGLKIPDSDSNPKAPAPKEMVDLEAMFERIETELKEVNTNAEALKRNYLELTELREVLLKTQSFFLEQHGTGHSIVEDAQHALVHDEFVPGAAVHLGFIAGVIPRERVPAFERMLWFACRGNVFLRYEEILQPLEDAHTGDAIHKGVFIVFFQGEQLKNRVRKICEGFKATLYPCPENASERQEMFQGVSTRLEDLNIVLKQTMDHRHRVLLKTQNEIHNWIIKVKKIKAIYHTLNMCNFDVSHNSLIAECWAPVKVLDQVQAGLQHGQEVSGSTVPNILHTMPTKETPPTYFETNRFTKVFQSIVDAYGVATYREVNPAVYTIISFPFLFAVMFGDSGHGFIMFCFGLWMVVSEKKLVAQKTDNEIWKIFLAGRYIVMMMGLFSVYTGLVYNDIFSKSVSLFPSSWHPKYSNETLDDYTQLMMAPEDAYSRDNEGPYPFGLDPVWQSTQNKITFTNSFKMKLSVIFGISQMLLGVLLSLINHIHFRRWLNVFVQFIPEILFLLCIFGYLIILVFYKWLTFVSWCNPCAPALLIQFINMFLIKYEEPTSNTYPCNADMTEFVDVKLVGCDSKTTFYPHQQVIQLVLVGVAVICIPILLLVKPIYEYCTHKAKLKRKTGLQAHSDTHLVSHEEQPGISEAPSAETKKQAQSGIELSGVGSNDVTVSINGETSAVHIDDEEWEKDDFDFGDIFVNQAIHTIEYCLGCVSHTASYLRLWALSLAHAQLSEVLWSMLFRFGLSLDMKYVGALMIWAIFAAFAALTVAVLLVMEGLSAFLHTLRLHWVEFNSKFYHGDGYHFTPFTFKDQLNPTLDEK